MFAGISFTALALAVGLGAAEAPDVPTPQPEVRWAEALALHGLSAVGGNKGWQPESVLMLDAIWQGRMGPTDGWFRPSQSRLGWSWLAQRYDADGDGRITRAEFDGPDPFFDRLDRDHDGTLTPADLDWSENSPLARQQALVHPWFARVDADSNGRITRAEWDQLFTKLAGDRDHLTPEDLRRLLFPPPPPATAKKQGMPSRQTLLAGLFANELGSPYEGPRVGQLAPRFTLTTHDGTRKVALADCLGKKPVVLIFGSFT